MPDSSLSPVTKLYTPKILSLITAALGIICMYGFGISFVKDPVQFLTPEGILYWVTVLLLGIINTYFHELCHSWAFLQCTQEKGIINRNILLPRNCSSTTYCSAPIYKLVGLAPILALTPYWTISLLLPTIFKSPSWLFHAFSASSIVGLMAMSNDFFWVYKLRRYDSQYVVKDYGSFAEVFRVKN